MFLVYNTSAVGADYLNRDFWRLLFMKMEYTNTNTNTNTNKNTNTGGFCLWKWRGKFCRECKLCWIYIICNAKQNCANEALFISKIHTFLFWFVKSVVKRNWWKVIFIICSISFKHSINCIFKSRDGSDRLKQILSPWLDGQDLATFHFTVCREQITNFCPILKPFLQTHTWDTSF